MAGENDIQIKVEVDDAQATAKIENLGNQVKNIEQAANESAGGFSKLQASVISISSAVSLAQTAFAAVTGAVAGLFAAIERGSQIDDVASAFDKLAAKSGALSEIFLGQLKQATGDTISSFDLMRKANEALQSGIKPDQYLELTKAARVLAEETGGNLTDELRKLEQAFATGQDRILKNRLGVIDLQKAEEELAAKLKTTRDKLDESQRTFAARNAIIDAAKKKTKEFGDVENDAGDQIARVSVILADFRDRILRVIGTSQTLTKLLTILGDVLKKLEPVVNALIKVFEFLDAAIAKVIDTIDTVNKAMASFQDTITDVLRKTLPSFDLGMTILEKTFGDTAEAIQTTSDAVAQVVEQAPELESVVVPAVEAVGDAAVKAAQEVAVEMPKILEATRVEIEQTTSELVKGIQGIIGSALGSGDFGILGQLGGLIGDSLGSTLGDSIGASIGGSLGEALGPIAGSAIGSYIGQGIETVIGNLQNGDYADAITNALNTFIPGLGSVTSSITDKFFSFGSDNEGTKAKKAADKFFAEVLDANRLAVVIDGQLTEISDLVFNGNNDGTGIYAGLDAETQLAFAGVGDAFQSLLGIASEVGVNIGNVLANNLGGSLNNLQILVERTGISFDKLRDQVVKAFLDGQLSATQAAQALAGIQKISEKGIPDALGAVDQAFQNLVASGESGGAAIVDALGDIGAEAEELSISSLKGVQDFLVSTGKFTAEQIQATFEALQAAGITSVEQLKNITAEQAIQIAAALQATGVVFDDTSKSAGNIAEELNNIPSEIRTTVRVRFVSEGDRNAAAAVGQSLGASDYISTPGGLGYNTNGSSFSR